MMSRETNRFLNRGVIIVERVATTGLKLDLHIHSQNSRRKDGKKVQNNTLENIPILVSKLNEQGVNICAITDHDAFSYQMYELLKDEENKGSILKVFPGVEFSVRFRTDEEREIHIVAIFSDEEEEKIKRIETVLKEHPVGESLSYDEEGFLRILREIDIDTILIAYQKNSLMSDKPRKHDADYLGKAKFFEFVYSDYFEAFEFKNKRNEILNKTFLNMEGLEERVRFVTGTDCHDWSVYPLEKPGEKTEGLFPFTYAKCLPTFRGLVMAMTDHTRLKRENSFFNVAGRSISSIVLKRGKERIEIPLSLGINAIIGDNSVGKSMLLHAVTKYEKAKPGCKYKLRSEVKKGYINHLNELEVSVETAIEPADILCFDMQGEVRAKFEERNLDASVFFSDFFSMKVDAKRYQDQVEKELDKLLSYLKKKFSLEERVSKLGRFGIEVLENPPESLTFMDNLRKTKVSDEAFIKIIDSISVSGDKLRELNQLSIDAADRKQIEVFLGYLDVMLNKYRSRKVSTEKNNNRIEQVASIIDAIDEEHRRSKSDYHKRQVAFGNATQDVQEQIVALIQEYRALKPYVPSLMEVRIDVNHNTIKEYEFISKLCVDEIGPEYFYSLINQFVKADKQINWQTVTEQELRDGLKYVDGEKPILAFFKEKVLEQINKDFQPAQSIIVQGNDRYADMSAGFDAKVYFNLLSWERKRPGIYMIDQPEDNISQSAIREYLLDRFKVMGESRQVIMVTHNPQFIVNLDVDNLIYLSMKDGKLCAQFGALEYHDSDTDILRIVADNIDGGLESIQKRWKRYDKAYGV